MNLLFHKSNFYKLLIALIFLYITYTIYVFINKGLFHFYDTGLYFDTFLKFNFNSEKTHFSIFNLVFHIIYKFSQNFYPHLLFFLIYVLCIFSPLIIIKNKNILFYIFFSLSPFLWIYSKIGFNLNCLLIPLTILLLKNFEEKKKFFSFIFFLLIILHSEFNIIIVSFLLLHKTLQSSLQNKEKKIIISILLLSSLILIFLFNEKFFYFLRLVNFLDLNLIIYKIVTILTISLLVYPFFNSNIKLIIIGILPFLLILIFSSDENNVKIYNHYFMPYFAYILFEINKIYLLEKALNTYISILVIMFLTISPTTISILSLYSDYWSLGQYQSNEKKIDSIKDLNFFIKKEVDKNKNLYLDNNAYNIHLHQYLDKIKILDESYISNEDDLILLNKKEKTFFGDKICKDDCLLNKSIFINNLNKSKIFENEYYVIYQ